MKNLQEVKERLMQCLNKNGIDIMSETSQYDSIAYITTIIDIESEFNITFPDELLNIQLFQNTEKLTAIVVMLLDENSTNEHEL